MVRALAWVIAPAWAACACVALVLSVPLLLLGHGLDRVGHPTLLALTRLLRAYVLGELRLVAAAGRGSPDDMHARLRDMLASLVDAATSTLGLEIVIDSDPAVRAALADRARPLLVLSRHAGPGDSVLVLHLLLSRFRRRPAVVMKEALTLDPGVRSIARCLPVALVGGDDEQDCDDVSRLAAGLRGADALLLFPEGGNFTPTRRRAAIRWLRRHGHRERATRAEGLQHMLAPRPGGALAAMRAAPGADVIFSAHTGLGSAAKGLALLRDLPRDRRIEFRLWLAPAAERPSDDDALVTWLDGWWSRLDDWVEERGQEACAR